MGHVIGIDTTYTGNPVSFNAAHGGTMKSVSVPFSPTQNLHGYSSPWPGGGGKNKCSMADQTFVQFLEVEIDEIPAGTYKYSAVVTSSDTDVTQCAIIFLDADKNTLSSKRIDRSVGGSRVSIEFTVASPIKYVRLYASTGYPSGAGDTATFADNMICLASATDPTVYAPYSNICPISGLAGLSVYRTGKNLFDPDSLETVTVNTLERFGHKYSGVGTYAIKAYATGTAGYVYAKVLNTDGTWGSNIYVVANTTATEKTVTISAGQTLFVYNASAWTESASSELFNGWKVQVVLSSTQPDSYEPYNGNTYSVDWTTEAGTVYGGTLDVVTGQLVVDRGCVNVSSSWNWIKSGSYPGGFYADIQNAGTGQKKNTPFICSHAKTATSTSQYVQGTCFCDGSINIRIMDGSDTVQDWKDYIDAQITAGTPIQICYELATPVTYQLTPKQIAALIGQNYIWSSNNETLTAVLTAPATGFAGWLIKCVTNGTPVEIPLKYMRAETYTVTPDQRMEWSAERDVTGVLHRETVQNLPPKIEFNTPLMANSEINALNSIIKAAFTSYLQRNITIQFYDPERDQYWEWDCYMPDVKYHIRNADIVNNVINYEELRYAFIGY